MRATIANLGPHLAFQEMLYRRWQVCARKNFVVLQDMLPTTSELFVYLDRASERAKKTSNFRY